MSDRWNTSRLEAFSDGVFAIAITLLILEISVPESGFEDLWKAIADQWSSYLAYATSFLTIGGIWMAHHGIFRRLASADSMVMRLNLLLLGGAPRVNVRPYQTSLSPTREPPVLGLPGPQSRGLPSCEVQAAVPSFAPLAPVHWTPGTLAERHWLSRAIKRGEVAPPGISSADSPPDRGRDHP
jgi:Endosomal/lysosomal potassium channel TMEM175